MEEPFEESIDGKKKFKLEFELPLNSCPLNTNTYPGVSSNRQAISLKKVPYVNLHINLHKSM